ncbi:FHA domain-containing protein [Propionibacteriaceae bacterium Y2011]|uniref:FHA domain-containing protein n=1 Tax=Microlunatus sp. Y2014 TaxID=3418488 RepID=UPI003B4B717C
MPYCTHCGHQNPDGSNYCARCGEALSKVAPASTDSASDPEADTEVNQFDSTQVIRAITDDGGPPLTGAEEAAIRALPEGSALLILNRGSDRSERFLLATDTTAAGRHPRSEIFLDDITVSRKHALFTRSHGAVKVEDLGSLNGTYVNRRLIDQATELHSGDEVMIGKFRLIYFASEHGLG